ncbi:MAG: PTS sugar transporter subunit IIB [Deferribacteraceae bacterium]|jgi:mannose/fructose/N-acetylgalactosamine-specific phosphotransferase system component IIB|nr:PTS sugar transporter subunit IIB [Deferribacteraceae bacterium]
MKQIIFRADDRLIHGQVIEGWIKNFNIPSVLIVNDTIASDLIQQTIYQSVVPAKTTVDFYSISRFKDEWSKIKNHKGALLVLFSSIDDLCKSTQAVGNEDIYLNIGCIASRTHSIAVSDTVFLEPEELCLLGKLAVRWDIHIKKLPWEKDAAIPNS